MLRPLLHQRHLPQHDLTASVAPQDLYLLFRASALPMCEFGWTSVQDVIKEMWQLTRVGIGSHALALGFVDWLWKPPAMAWPSACTALRLFHEA